MSLQPALILAKPEKFSRNLSLPPHQTRLFKSFIITSLVRLNAVTHENTNTFTVHRPPVASVRLRRDVQPGVSRGIAGLPPRRRSKTSAEMPRYKTLRNVVPF